MIPYWLASPEWTHVVAALLHTLWQGTLIAVLLGLMLRRLTNPVVRYRCTLGALVGVMAAGLVTWGILCRPLPATTLQAPANLPVAAVPAAMTTDNSAPLIVQVRPLVPNAPDVRWTAWLALLWVVGTLLMLGRAAFQVAGAERLRRSSRPLEDPRIMALLAEAREAVGLLRRVRLAATDQLTSPVVAGVLVPTLILPLSLVSSLAPEQIRFILLHELAHIRRGDYFANLFQLFAEALLFFNPAVWWISRQMRLEREACCDALAVELSGAPADYARTLVRVVENALSPAPAAAPALGDRREPSSLADRLQRMLVPGYRPALRLTWCAMFAALLTGGVLLFLSAVGTRETIAAIPGSGQAGNEQKINTPQVLITGACYQMPANSISNMITTMSFKNQEAFTNYQTTAEKKGWRLLSRPHIQTLSGTSGDLYIGDGTNGIRLNCLPVVTSGEVALTCSGQLTITRPGGPVAVPIATQEVLKNGGGVMITTRGMGQADTGNALLLLSVEILTDAPPSPTPAADAQSARPAPALIMGFGNGDVTVDDAQPAHSAQFLIQAEIYQVSPENFESLIPGLEFHSGQIDAEGWWSASPEQFSRLQTGVKKSGLKPVSRPRIQTSNGMEAQFFVGNDEGGTELDCQPTLVDGKVQLEIRDVITDRRASNAGTNSFAADALLENHGGMVFSLQPIGGGASNFMVMVGVQILTNTPSAHLKDFDGILSDTNFRATLEALSQRTGVETLGEPEIPSVAGRGENRLYFPPTWVDITNRASNSDSAQSPGTSTTETAKTITFKLEHPVGAAALRQALEQAGVQFPATALFYTDGGVFLARGTPEQLALVNGVVRQLNGFSTNHPAATAEQFIANLQQNSIGAQTANANQLFMRTFKLDKSLFLPALQQAMKVNLPDSGSTASSSADPSQTIRDFFQGLGLDLSASSGKSVFFNSQKGLLFVKATDSDFDTIERALQLLNTSDPRLQSSLVDEAKVPYTSDELALSRNPLTLNTNPSQRSIHELPAGSADLLASAQRHFANREFDAAEADYQKILERDENNGLVLANLATIELQEGKPDEAEKHITAALAQRPDDAYNLSTLGYLKFRQGKYDDALDVLSRAAKIDPNNPEIQNYLGVTLSHKRLLVQAETAQRTKNPTGIFPGQPPIEPDPTNPAGDTTPADLPGQQTMTFRLNDPKPAATVRQLLLDAGVQMPPTTFVCADGRLLVVRGTPEQLALVYGLVLKLNGHSAQEIAAGQDSLAQHLATNAVSESTNLFMRTFMVDTNQFQVFLKKYGDSDTNVVAPIKNLFSQLGLDFGSNTGKAIFYNDRSGILFVRTTTSDLATVEQVLATIQQTGPEIHIKARFIEASEGTLEGFMSLTGGKLMGILTGKNAGSALKALEAQEGTEILAAPEITVLSGRRAQMRATELISVVTNNVPDPNGNFVAQTGKFEVGPVLNVAPRVLADGYTISLEVNPSLTEFVGYAQTNRPSSNRGFTHPPIFQTQTLNAPVNIWDGQTVVLGGMGNPTTNVFMPIYVKEVLSLKGLFEPKPIASQKELLVLITASIVDSTGARVHTDEEMPFAQSDIPTQPRTPDNGLVTSYGQPQSTSVRINDPNTEASMLVQEGKLLYEKGDLAEAKAKFIAALALNPDNATAIYYGNLIDAALSKADPANDVVWTVPARGPRPSASKAAPPNDVIWTGPGRQAIVAKMNHIRLDSVSWDGLPLSEVLQQLSVQCKALDPEHKGVNFLINNNPDLSGPVNVASAGAGATGIDPATGQPVAASSAEPGQPDVGSYIIKIPSLSDIRLADALDAIVMVSDHPLKYSIQDFAIVFSSRAAASPQLFTQTFVVDPNTFSSGLEGVGARSFGVNQNNNGGSTPVVGVVNTFSGEGAARTSGGGGDTAGSGGAPTLQSVQHPDPNSRQQMQRLDLFGPQSDGGHEDGAAHSSAASVASRASAYFTTLGVNLETPGKSIFYNDRTGVLSVRATKEDLKIIKRALQNTNAAPVDSRY